MPIEGQLRFDMRADDRGSYVVSLQSTRPVRASRVLVGRTPDEALSILPRLFRICGIAQAGAAASALEQATGQPADAGVAAARQALIALETAREHAWRMLVDWPALIDLPPAPGRVRALDALLAETRRSLFASGEAFRPDSVRTGASTEVIAQRLELCLRDAVFGVASGEWLKMSCAAALQRWCTAHTTSAALFVRHILDSGWQGIGDADVAALPALTSAEIDERLAATDADAFIERPTWQGKPRETNPLQRMRRHPLIETLAAEFGLGLLSRAAAELLELASIPAAIASALRASVANDQGETLTPGTGIGQVEAARGRLLHRVVLDADKVSSYQIVAPTEWNFHPQGSVLSALAKLSGGDADDVKRKGSMLITTVDPCVGFTLAVH